MKRFAVLLLALLFSLQPGDDTARAEGLFDNLRKNFVRDVEDAVDAVKRKHRRDYVEPLQDQRLTQREVARLQQGLNTLGYNVGVADGIAGPATQQGIDRFLRDHGHAHLSSTPSREVLLAIETASFGSAGSTAPAPTPVISGQVTDQAPVLGTQQAGLSNIGTDPASGVPMLQGRPAVLTKSAIQDLLGQKNVRSWNSQQESWELAWAKLQDLLLLGQHPIILEDEDTALGYAMTFLNDAEKRDLFGPDYSHSSSYKYQLDEFQRRQAAERFRQQYAAQLIASAPKLPFSLVEVRDVYLGEYDFGEQIFPITYRGSKGELATELPKARASMRRYALVTSPPAHSPILSLRATQAEAQQLLPSLEEDRTKTRKGYLGIFSTITAINIERDPTAAATQINYRFYLDTKIDQVAFYADPALRQLVTSFDVGQTVAASASDQLNVGTSTESTQLDAAATPAITSLQSETLQQQQTFPADIIGLRLDMPFEEADAIIRSHMSVGQVFEAKRQPLPDPNLVVPYSSGRLYVSDDGMEFIQVYDEPPAAASRIKAAIRWVHRPEGSMSPDAALAALKKKYGEPSSLSGGAKPYFVWGNNANDHRCDPGRSANRSANWQPADQASSALVLPKEVNIRSLPAIGLQISTSQQIGGCGVTIAARLDNGKTDQMTVWLADQDAYANTLLESKKRVEAGESASGSGDAPAGQLDIKM